MSVLKGCNMMFSCRVRLCVPAALVLVVCLVAKGCWASSWFGSGQHASRGRRLRVAGGDGSCNIKRIPSADFTQARFIQEFEGQKPFILTGATKGWLANGWDRRNVKAHTTLRDVRLRASHYGIRSKKKVSFVEMFDHIFDPSRPEHLRKHYGSIDGSALLDHPVLLDGYRTPWWAWERSAREHADAPPEGQLVESRNFIRVLNREAAIYLGKLVSVMQKRPLKVSSPINDRYMISGPAAAGGAPHIDPYNQSFWNAIVRGRKRWTFFSAEHLEALRTDEPAVVAGWALGADATAYDWYDNWYDRIKNGWPWARDGWLWKSPPRFRLYECTLEEGELIYGPGGMMHVVLTLEDSLVLSEQLLGPADYQGAMQYEAAESSGLVKLGLCDRSITELRPQTIRQLEILATPAWGAERPSAEEVEQPNRRVVQKIDRIAAVTTWLSYCGAVFKVRPDLWKSWGACARLHQTCGDFVSDELKFRTDYEWYPDFVPKPARPTRNPGRKGRKRSKLKVDL
jgi:hypothetical protein